MRVAGARPAVIAVACAVNQIQHREALRRCQIARGQIHLGASFHTQRLRPVFELGDEAVRHILVIGLEPARGARHLEGGVRAGALARERGALRIGHPRAVDAEVEAIVVGLDRLVGGDAPQPLRVARHRQTAGHGNDIRDVTARDTRFGRGRRAQPEGHAPVGQHLDRGTRGRSGHEAAGQAGFGRGGRRGGLLGGGGLNSRQHPSQHSDAQQRRGNFHRSPCNMTRSSIAPNAMFAP